MTQAPCVSVIIPFYNRVEWMIEAAQSVLGQSFTDFELILVDDGSAQPIDNNFLSSDHRIRYIRQPNGGASSARNTGILNAKGKYIAFLDSDDLYTPDKLAIQVKFMNENPEIDLSFTSYLQIDRDKRIINEISMKNYTSLKYPEILYCCPIASPTVMVKRSVLKNKYVFDKTLKCGEDVLLWILITKDFKIAFIDQYLTKVRIHGTNAILNETLQINSHLKVIRKFFKRQSISWDNFILKRRILSDLYYNFYIITRNTSRIKSFGYYIFSRIYYPFKKSYILNSQIK